MVALVGWLDDDGAVFWVQQWRQLIIRQGIDVSEFYIQSNCTGHPERYGAGRHQLSRLSV